MAVPCGMSWERCPRHRAAALTTVSGESWCSVPECEPNFAYDRLGQPCAEPATHRITDRHGASITACQPHASEAGQWLDGATVELLAPGERW